MRGGGKGHTHIQVLYIADMMSRPGYVPRNPTAEDLSNVFDTRFPTVQPYLHRVSEWKVDTIM